LSKVIKARFVVNDEQGCLQAWASQKQPKKEEMHPQTPLQEDSAAELYQETKALLEELLAEGQQKADQLILEAREQAAEHLERSRLESEAYKETAYQEGFERGYNEARDRFDEEMRSVRESFAALLTEFQLERKKRFAEQQKDIVELIFALMNKIVGIVVESAPEAMGVIIEDLLEQVKENEKVVVRVNPIHIPYLCGFGDKFQIIDDAEILPGNCQIITENGFIDSQIDEQLSLLKHALLEAVDHDGN